MATLEVLHPVAEILPASVPAARRLDKLEGKTVGLFWNMKAGGDAALQAVAAELARRHPGLVFQHYVGSVGSTYRQATPEDVERMAAECDAVVGTSGD
jgi:hypothetical protein